MSSIPGYDLEDYIAWNFDFIVDGLEETNVSLSIAEALGQPSRRKKLSEAKFSELIAKFYEPYRETVEYLLDDFDEETQSWRDYAGTCFDIIPQPVHDQMLAWLDEYFKEQEFNKDSENIWKYDASSDNRLLKLPLPSSEDTDSKEQENQKLIKPRSKVLNMTNEKENVVLYHANCVDGYGAAYIAHKVLGDSAIYIGIQYRTKAESLVDVTDKNVFILDFSFPSDEMEEIKTKAKSVVWLDHHLSKEDEDKIFCVTTNDNGKSYYEYRTSKKSGAMLAVDYFTKEHSELIAYIDDRDRWVYNKDFSREINTGLNANKPWTFEQWKTFDTDEGVKSLIAEGKMLTKYMDVQINDAVRQAVRCTLRKSGMEFKGMMVNSGTHISEIGQKLTIKTGTFGMTYFVSKENLVVCSMRSKGEYDVAKIAKLFGGGGHPNAAGFSVTLSEFEKFKDLPETDSYGLNNQLSKLVIEDVTDTKQILHISV